VAYRLTDARCDPADTSQTFVEVLVRLPGCFLCFTPAHDAPAVAPPPAAALGAVTFGSFNALAKVTPAVLRAWAAILRAVPRSRLVVKNKPFACEVAKARVLALWLARVFLGERAAGGGWGRVSWGLWGCCRSKGEAADAPPPPHALTAATPLRPHQTLRPLNE